MSEIAVSVEQLDVRYRVHPHPQLSLHEALLSLGRSRGMREIEALRDVSFEVRAGEVLGAIGPNGSGKTTLLKTLAGIIPPTSGRVDVEGRIGSLIELAGGFNPELTGAENVRLQCALLGLDRREIEARFDAIVDFSGLGHVMDVSVKNYSAGMHMRLGFSISAQSDADVLLIDEILAVGDLEFQQKSYDRILELIAGGTAAVVVSHDPETIERLCDRAMVLGGGRLLHLGDVGSALGCYHALSFNGEGRDDAGAEARRAEPEYEGSEPDYEGQPALEIPDVEPEGSGEARVSKVVFLDADGEETATIASGGALRIRVEYQASEPVDDPVFGIGIFTEEWIQVTGPNTLAGGFPVESIGRRGAIEYEIPSVRLMPGDYLVIASIFEEDLVTPIDHSRRCYRLTVAEGSQGGSGGVVELGGSWSRRPG